MTSKIYLIKFMLLYITGDVSVEKPQELVSLKKYMPPPFTEEAEGAYIF
jgi:hypothetical protein